MTKTRERTTLALLLVIALVSLFAVPVFAFAEETTDAAVTDAAPAEEAAPVEEAAPAEAPAEEAAPVEEAAAEAPAEEVAEEVAPAESDAPTFKDGSDGMSVEELGARVTRKVTKKITKARAGTSRVSKDEHDDGGQIVDDNDCVGGLNSDLDDFVLELVGGEGVFDSGTGNTTFTWQLIYTGDKEDCAAADYVFSHVNISPCLGVLADVVDTNGTFSDGKGWYEWQNPTASHGDVVGDLLWITFEGDVDTASGTGISAKKSDATNGQSTVLGPSCSTVGCETYTLSASVSGATGTVSVDNLSTDGSPWAAGESVQLTAPTIDNHTFTGWSGDRTPSPTTTNPLTVTFSETDTDCVLSMTANYTQNQGGCETHTLNTAIASNDNGASGTLSVDNLTTDGSPWAAGEQVSITAPAINGYTFSGWTGERTSTANPLTVTFDSQDSDCILTLTANYTKDVVIPGCVDCPPPPTPDCNGDFDSTNNGPNGDCTIPPLPDCSGDFDPTNNGPNGDCIEPLVDVCPNIDGEQAEVPDDMVVNPVTGACEEDQVLGEIINRPKPNKPESVLNAVQPKVLPKQLPAVAALPFTGGNMIPFLMVAGMMMGIGAGVVLRTRRGTIGS